MKTNKTKRAPLSGLKIAILVANGFEQIELTSPRAALEMAGAKTEIVSPANGVVRGWIHTRWGKNFRVTVSLAQAKPSAYDALLLPGGVMNPDELRQLPAALRFVKSFFKAGKPVAAICHGALTLIDAGVVSGRLLTSYPSIQTDLKNAGANWVNRKVVVSEGLVTSRTPDDLPAFNKNIIAEFSRSNSETNNDPGWLAVSPL